MWSLRLSPLKLGARQITERGARTMLARRHTFNDCGCLSAQPTAQAISGPRAGVIITCVALSGIATVSVIVTSEPLLESTRIEFVAAVGDRAIQPSGPAGWQEDRLAVAVK
jgi:hypothetical protein